ncbi:MAG: NAD(P)/FAD-dependent oxidoreductase [Dehalococcoidales bacterium]|nr:NAD(P)/FAD-dependent oxidoreductase [Dehalococcoidales bacterium]
MSNEVDAVIIGAGVVGLSVAYHAARERRNIYVLEKNEGFGRETSSRNSGTIHTGILSPGGSLNARLCLEGNAMLYRFCEVHGVEHRRTGKLLVASGDIESAALEALYQRRDEGIEMERLSSREMRRLEPDVRAQDGVLLPAAGVVDAYGLMRCFLGLASMKGVQLACGSEVTGIEKTSGGYRIFIRDRTGVSSFESGTVINCAGLASDSIAALAGINVDDAGYRLTYFKGEYYSLCSSVAKRMDRRLIYPMLKTGGLVGIHTVLDVDGRVRLGPDFYPVEEIDYTMDARRKPVFLEGARGLFSFIQPEDIEPESCGIMPRAYGRNEEFRSFVIRHEDGRGLPGFINVLGIESPGLTASPAIGRRVADLLDEIL